MNTQSSLYQEISREQLDECCHRYLGEALTDGKLLSGGLFNTTYLMQTATRRAVLRLGPVNRHLVQPYERRLMEAESLVLDELERRGIPSSRCLALDLSRECLDRDVMVVEALPGVSASTLELDETAAAKLCRETGALAEKIHRITASDILPGEKKPFGRIGNVISGEGGATWVEAVRIEVEHWCALAGSLGMASLEFIERVRALFARYSDVLEAVTTANLVHADLWFGNLLVDRNGALIAIIDGDRALFGDPEWEFASGWMTGSDFYEGYDRKPDPSPESVLRRRLYKLLMNLEDAYVLKYQYNQPENALRIFECARQELAELENMK